MKISCAAYINCLSDPDQTGRVLRITPGLSLAPFAKCKGLTRGSHAYDTACCFSKLLGYFDTPCPTLLSRIFLTASKAPSRSLPSSLSRICSTALKTILPTKRYQEASAQIAFKRKAFSQLSLHLSIIPFLIISFKKSVLRQVRKRKYSLLCSFRNRSLKTQLGPYSD